MDNNNIDMASLMTMLSKMDKSKLENGLSQVSKVLNSKEADKIIEQVKQIQINRRKDDNI